MSQRISRFDFSDIRRKFELYLSVNRFDAAEKLLKSAISDYGPLPNLLNWLGLTYHRQSRFGDAIKEFHRAIQINPEFLEAGLNLAVTLCDLSRYQDARNVFQKLMGAVDTKKRHPNLILGRLANHHVQNGLAYEQNGMLGDAIQEYRKALQLFDNMPEVRLTLAKLYVRVGQNEKAKQELEEIIKHRPDLAEPHTWLGILHYKSGQKDRAKHHWDLAQSANPDDSSSRAYSKLLMPDLG